MTKPHTYSSPSSFEPICMTVNFSCLIVYKVNSVLRDDVASCCRKSWFALWRAVHCTIAVPSLNWMRKPCILVFFCAAGPCLTLGDSERKKMPPSSAWLVWDVKANNSTCWLFQPAQKVWDLLTLRKRWNLNWDKQRPFRGLQHNSLACTTTSISN